MRVAPPAFVQTPRPLLPAARVCFDETFTTKIIFLSTAFSDVSIAEVDIR